MTPQLPPSPLRLPALEARLLSIEERLRRLEAVTYKRQGLRAAIRGLIQAWPGPFTAVQMHTALLERTQFTPTAGAVSIMLAALEKKAVILRVHQGRGSVGNIWERNDTPPDPRAARMNRQHAYESGFRHIVRSALADETFPKHFTLADLKNWMAAHMPAVKVPYGSWSSTLYKLQQQGELVIVKDRHTVPRKVYARGERIVMPSGDELRDLEAAWHEFKRVEIATPPAPTSAPAASERSEARPLSPAPMTPTAPPISHPAYADPTLRASRAAHPL